MSLLHSGKLSKPHHFAGPWQIPICAFFLLSEHGSQRQDEYFNTIIEQSDHAQKRARLRQSAVKRRRGHRSVAPVRYSVQIVSLLKDQQLGPPAGDCRMDAALQTFPFTAACKWMTLSPAGTFIWAAIHCDPKIQILKGEFQVRIFSWSFTILALLFPA